jgi:hypothetical protein
MFADSLVQFHLRFFNTVLALCVVVCVGTWNCRQGGSA